MFTWCKGQLYLQLCFHFVSMPALPICNHPRETLGKGVLIQVLNIIPTLTTVNSTSTYTLPVQSDLWFVSKVLTSRGKLNWICLTWRGLPYKGNANHISLNRSDYAIDPWHYHSLADAIDRPPGLALTGPSNSNDVDKH